LVSLLDVAPAALSPNNGVGVSVGFMIWLSLTNCLLVAVRSGEHYCFCDGSPACSQIRTQAYFIAFFQASATALIRASLFWDVSDVLKQPVCPICQATSSTRQMVPICSPSTSVA